MVLRRGLFAAPDTPSSRAISRPTTPEVSVGLDALRVGGCLVGECRILARQNPANVVG